MQYAKEIALKNVYVQNTQLSNVITQKLLKWNSFPLINFEPNKIDIYFGVFLFQIIKFSQNTQLQTQFKDIMNKIQFERDNKQHFYAELCRKITKKITLSPFPDSIDFQILDESIQESLEFEMCGPQFWQSKSYQSTKLQSKEPVQFKILFYQNANDNNLKQLLIFSTNKSLFRMQSFPVVSQSTQPNLVRFTQVNVAGQQNQGIQITNQNPTQIFVPQQWTQQQSQQYPQPQFNNMVTTSQYNNYAVSQNHQEFRPNILNQNNPNNFKVPNGLQMGVSIQGNNQNQNNNNFVPNFPSQRTEYQQQYKQNNLVNQPKCFNDQVDIFTTECIAKKEEDVTNMKPQYGVRILTKQISKAADKSFCQICYENYDLHSDEAIKTPCCNMMAHMGCMLNTLNENAKQNMNLETIKCYLCQKSLKEYQEFLRRNISKQLIFEIKIKEVLAKVSSKCCKCNSPIQASSEYKQLQIQCLKCNTLLCRHCYQEYHGENQAQCPNLLKEILKAIDGMPVLVCPFCGLMQTKDEKCNHVKCHGCQQDLCSACSVDRAPILSHGNHYHRVGCPDYQPWMQNGKVMTQPDFDRRKCQRCQETGQGCQYPISLEEYKKLKQF
ncbi:unnamed protein product [Paramecium octaurelia]|uniref:RING-type domain-containing protein n=1 Tax=Paramecium octaurelia TaxID=43137 RepID=A0A8S1YPF4_PAROT|nr:unnamed protein product [Paramecium octaurelia]